MLKNNFKLLSILSVLAVCLVPVASSAAPSKQDAKHVAATANKNVKQEVSKVKTVNSNGKQVVQKEIKSVKANNSDKNMAVQKETKEVAKTQKKKGWFSWLGF